MNPITDLLSLVEVLQAMIKFIEAVDPNAAKNPVVVKVQNVINELHALNL